MSLPSFERIDRDLLVFLSEQYGEGQLHAELALSAPLQERRAISRQAATALLNRLVRGGVLEAVDKTRPKRYKLRSYGVLNKVYKLDGLEEHVVWANDLMPALEQYAGREALSIWEYGVTEMINNAIDHSEGGSIHVRCSITAIEAICYIKDDGEGIFRRIKRICDLADERQAILELSKGKLTTDPSRHTGEGLFFTSRAMDWFMLESYGLFFSHAVEDGERNWLIESDDEVKGSLVMMELMHNTGRTLKELFNQFAEPDSFSFNKTVVPVRLVKIGAESLISRSQAHRLLARVDKFEKVILDFEGVESIGQAFADEIFRVFQKQYPEVDMTFRNANDDVQLMIRRAIAGR
ncbi:MAG: DUF4325 domain-containing protein [Alcaligenaceae bacterium]|nr:DUF4325 domain-containing protein [Alcaligenaceae bacterium]